jgi:DNA polymerase III subunit epsilon
LTRPDRSSWRAARFVAVDVETTGLDPQRDEIISFAAVPIEAGRIAPGEAVSGLVRPRLEPVAASVQIHGLRPVDLEAAAPPPDALAPLAAALRGRIPVAHAAWVERGFLAPPLRELGMRWPRRTIDTAALWRLLCIDRGLADPGWCGLASVVAARGLPSHRPHEAEGDALTAAQLFLSLATHLEGHGHRTVRALAEAERHVRGWRLWHPPR